MATGLGTLNWVEKTGGKMAWYERLNLTYQAVREQLALNRRIKAGKRFRYIEFDDIIPPDSPMATEAVNFSKEVCPPFLFNHSIRAWFWARLLDDQSTPVDHEVTFIALILHDIGLTETFRTEEHLKTCFTLSGARKAQELGAKHNWDAKRTDLIANAITLHMNLRLSKSHGREAELVKNGTGADVIGLRLETIYQDQINDLLTKYPRLNQNEEIIRTVKTETQERPCCRMAFFVKRLSMISRIRNSVFPE